MIQTAIIIQHVKGFNSRPLVACIGNERESPIEQAERIKRLLLAGCTQIDGADKMLCPTGQEDKWEDDLEVVVLDLT